jgi:L-iditol 2-dehydrogenase
MPFVFPGIVKIPKRNSFIEGALLEPVNTVLKAVHRLSLLRGDNVIVAGQGPIGLMFTRLLVLRGVHVIATDLLPDRLTLAQEMGAKCALQADAPDAVERMLAAARPNGIQAVVSAVPSEEVTHQAMTLLNGGGKLLLFAHTRKGVATALDLASVCVEEKDVVGSYSSDITIQEDVARLVFSRKLDVRRLVTHCFSLEGAPEAIIGAARPGAGWLKVVVCPGRVERRG